MSRARQGHTPLLSFRETAAMKPLPSFPLITCVLCRDLLYMSKGLRDFFIQVLENCKFSETTKKAGVYCLKPHVF